MYFTIITPSFNQGKFIESTILSVLSQRDLVLEYIINDGGSKDCTQEVLKKYNSDVIWTSEQDNGQSDAVNKGLKRAKGRYIGWINSDDLYYSQALMRVHEEFERNPDVDIVYGRALHIDINGGYIEDYPTEDWNDQRLDQICFLCQPAVFFRTSVLEKAGYLKDELTYCMDYEYWLRLRDLGCVFKYLPLVLSGSRMYSGNKTLGFAEQVHKEICYMFHNKYGMVPLKWSNAYWHHRIRNIRGIRLIFWINKVLAGPFARNIRSLTKVGRRAYKIVKRYVYYMVLPTISK